MKTKKTTLVEAIDVAIRTNRMEGLETSPDALQTLNQIKAGDVTLEEYGEAVKIKYEKLGKERIRISYDEALKIVREGK